MDYIAASDIVDLQDAISANTEVYSAWSLRHERSHSITSSADHSDVAGTPTAGDVFAWNSGDATWGPLQIIVTADGGTR